jgi:hypothetical protein
MDVGIDVDADALNKALRRIARQSVEACEAGAYAAGLMIQKEAQDRTPVEYGNLQGSAYTQRIPKGAQVGFTAEYALFVHENMEMKLEGLPRPSGLGTYWNPGGPKFLERAVSENTQEIMDMILAQAERVLKK